MRPVLRTTGFVLTILAVASWNWAHPKLDVAVRVDAPSQAEMDKRVEAEIEQKALQNAARAAQQVYAQCDASSSLSELTAHYALANHLSPRLVAATVITESGCHAGAVSRAGAVGLLQVNCRHTWKQYSRQELMNPDRNMEVGTRILASYIRQTGSQREGLRRYFGITNGSSASDDYADRVISKERNR
jgi:soluble lytic murein transglycosylase-like protein